MTEAKTLIEALIKKFRTREKDDFHLLLTHHDTWDFIFGLWEECQKLLQEYGISHYFNHAPLDDCEFGTNSSLTRELGWTEVKKVCETDGYMAGVIARPPQGTGFESVVTSLETLLVLIKY